MKKGTLVFISIIIILGISALLFMAFRKPSDKDKRKKGELCPDGKTPVPPNGICPQSTTIVIPDSKGCVQPSDYVNFSYPIKRGMKDGANVYDNKQVSVLQAKLNAKYKSDLKVDGYFGCNTEGVVKDKLGVTEVGYQNPIWNA